MKNQKYYNFFYYIKTLCTIGCYILKNILLIYTTSIFADDSRIKPYINNLPLSYAADFIHVDSKKNKFYGKIIIDQPNKIRLNYYKPFPLLIIGNDCYISIYDFELEQLNRIKNKDNILTFFYTDNITFDKNFTITKEYEINNQIIFTIEHKEFKKTGEIIFQKKTKELIAIKIFEDNDVITIIFNNIQKIKNIDKTLFFIQDPKIFNPPEQLNKEQIEKKYKIII